VLPISPATVARCIIEEGDYCIRTGSTWYNFARINSAVRMSPAMVARLTDRLWDIGDIVKLIEEWENQEVAA
jgi:hypothetical protein